MEIDFEKITRRRRFDRLFYRRDKIIVYCVGFLGIVGLVCMFKTTEDNYCYQQWSKMMAYRASDIDPMGNMIVSELRNKPWGVSQFRNKMANASKQDYTNDNMVHKDNENSEEKQERYSNNVKHEDNKGIIKRKEYADVNITHEVNNVNIKRQEYVDVKISREANTGNITRQDMIHEGNKSNIMNPKSTIHGPDTPTNLQYNILNDTGNLERLFSKGRRVKDVSCKLLLENNRNAILNTAALDYTWNIRMAISNSQYYQLSQNCTNFKLKRGYITSPITDIERDFPLAFSIIYYRDLEQMERLLRAIYRPQNTYCIHIDSKTLAEDKIVIRGFTSCFPNVFIASKSVDIQWGAFSVLEAELVCMKDLWAYPKWRYFINLTGQEFPLKTNLELVQILRAMQGANIVDGTWIRARANYFSRWLKPGKGPPHNIRPIKGSLHVAINRAFVDFALNDYRSKDFLVWLNGTEIPDESFFSSLNHNPQLRIPGSFLGDPEEYPLKPSFTRYKNWDIGHGVWTRKCSGKFVRNVCVLGVGDLHRLKDDIGLFVNKFHLDFEHYAFDCLEELMYNRTRDQYLNKQFIDVSFYSKLDQVRLRYVKPRGRRRSGWL